MTIDKNITSYLSLDTVLQSLFCHSLFNVHFVSCVRQQVDNMSNVLWSLKDVPDSVFDIC
jgi:hypothetical protein